jgi:hypothetical protein
MEIGNEPHIIQKASFGYNTMMIMVIPFETKAVGKISSVKDTITEEDYINIIKDSMENIMSDIKIINHGETTIDGQPAYWSELSGTLNVLNNQPQTT